MSASSLRRRTRRLLLLWKVHNKSAIVLGRGWPYVEGMIFLLAAGVIALVVLSVVVERATRAFLRNINRPAPVPDPDEIPNGSTEIMHELANVNQRIDDLVLAVDVGIKGYTRAENRVQKTVTSARRLVRESGLEHAGIEAEFEELHEGDGVGVEPGPAHRESGAPRVPAVPESVELDGPSGFPGISRSRLQELRRA